MHNVTIYREENTDVKGLVPESAARAVEVREGFLRRRTLDPQDIGHQKREGEHLPLTAL